VSAETKPTALVVVGRGLLAPWVDAEARSAILRLAEDANELTRDIDAATVTDPGSAARVTELLTLAATTAKRVDEERRRITDPLKRQAKEIEDAVRPLATALDALITAGKRKVLDWQRAEQERARKEREERERLEAEARRIAQQQAEAQHRPVELPAPLPPVAEAPRGVRTDYGTAAVRKVWTFEVVEEGQVPRSFLTVNEQAIRAAVNAGTREIPGVRIFQRDDLAVRAR
jgi:hypothetical protein